MAFLSGRMFNSIKPPLLGNLISSLRTPRLTSNFGSKNENHKHASAEIKHNTCSKNWNSVFQDVNSLLSTHKTNRIFAVVHLCGKQYKVTAGDIILVEGYWPPTIGDRIRLEKILLVGGDDFTMCGRPILETGLIDVQATIIEKTMTHTKTHFKKKRRKQYVRINFQRSPNTMIRINSIAVCGKVNEPEKTLNHVKIF